MRKLIEQALEEATFNMDKDVDFIYKKAGFDKIVKAMESGNAETMKKAFRGLKEWYGSSSELKSRVAKKAHKINPVTIKTGMLWDGSLYDPRNKIIAISLNQGAYTILDTSGYDAETVIRRVAGNKGKMLMKEFWASNIKGTIYHELTHWADDSLHNRHIKNTIDRAREGGQTSLKGKFSDVNHTPFELDAQIHAIKAIRKSLGKRAFDKMDWDDLFKEKSSLQSNFRNFKDKRDYMSMMKRFIKRLNREGLLGKGLKKIPSYNKISQI